MAKETITTKEYLQLQGLLLLAADQQKQISAIEDAAFEITGDHDCGHTMDALNNGFDAKTLIEKLGITVES